MSDTRENPLFIKRTPSRLERLNAAIRRAYQELVIIKKRIEILEEKTKTDTGGDYEFTTDHSPWEPHIVYLNTPYLIPAFLFGIIMGMVLLLVVT